jgi:hypothetical protein
MTALQGGVDLMAGIVRSPVLLDVVHNADPRMRPSTAARAALSVEVIANFPLPPDGIAIQKGDTATRPWCVVLIGDDEEQKVRIEGYAEDLEKPAIVEEIDFPPG